MYTYIYPLQHDNSHGGLASKEDGVYHHDDTDADVLIQSSQAHDPTTEGKKPRTGQTQWRKENNKKIQYSSNNYTKKEKSIS